MLQLLKRLQCHKPLAGILSVILLTQHGCVFITYRYQYMITVSVQCYGVIVWVIHPVKCPAPSVPKSSLLAFLV